MNRLRHVLWLMPLLLYSSDALAWGLYTHVYFAQQLVWAIPLADPRFRRAARALPGWLTAGACLPDLSLTGHYAGTQELRLTHQWDTAQAMLERACSDEERAISLGFVSHLLVDIIAHNHFVPAHERMWLHLPVLTHASAEWAMDAHLKHHVVASPAHLLRQHQLGLAHFAVEHFRCSHAEAERALVLLAHGEAVLRRSRLAEGLYGTAKVLDRNVKRRFNYYLRETSRRLVQVNQMLAGRQPAWQAEPPLPGLAHERVRRHTSRQIKYRLPLPLDLFLEVE
ncbi:MAG TPA: zinc dependent phospholipase C family protein [Gallionella sp.]|nr:zinc dependent phospholipase C family protein [Gallionella sp.]